MTYYRTRILPRLMHAMMDSDENRTIRARVCAGLEGTVLEIGFGSGLNTPHYPDGVHTVHAIEPATRSIALAADRIAACRAEVHHAGLTGEHLDLPDASIDAVLSTWTLCTIPDLAAALSEIRRVLTTTGLLHFVEHGISPDPTIARRQRRLEPVTRPVFGGCHLTRDIPALIRGAGFAIDTMTTYPHPKEPSAFGWTFEGCARPA